MMAVKVLVEEIFPLLMADGIYVLPDPKTEGILKYRKITKKQNY